MASEPILPGDPSIGLPMVDDDNLQSYVYDRQIRRFLLQFARMFSNFQINIGTEEEPILTRIPIMYGDMSRQVAEIIKNGSNNTFPCAPMFAFHINSLVYDRKNVQEPFFVDRRIVKQRQWNETTDNYEETQGNAFNVERHMPAPYILGLTIDYWSSNLETKLQALEQILWIFNPSLEIQSTDNYLDWTSLSTVEIDPSINWTNRSIPRGTQDDTDIDICTIKFTLPIWISPPAKVSKGGIIHKIIANVHDEKGDLINAIQNDDILLGTRQKITPHCYQVLLLGNELQLLRRSNPAYVYNNNLDPVPEQDSNVMWRPTIDEYGTINEGISQMRLEPGKCALGDEEREIVGTISYHPTNDNLLIFNIDTDTLPSNTLRPVDAVINPTRSGPGIGLPDAVSGTRYLLTDDIGNVTDNGLAIAWAPGGTELVARVNDIIEFNGTDWYVDWRANQIKAEYVTNLTTAIQYKWDLTSWVKSYEGIYPGGQWSLVF